VFSQLSTQTQPKMRTLISNQISQIRQMQRGAIDAQGSSHLHSSVQPSHCMTSLGQMSSLGLDLERQNSNGSALSLALMAAMKSRSVSFAQRDIRCYSSRDLGANVSLPSLAHWGSPTGKANRGSHWFWKTHRSSLYLVIPIMICLSTHISDTLQRYLSLLLKSVNVE